MPTFCFVCSFAGLSGRIPECFQRGTYPIEETGPCNDCPEYVTQLIGLWSDCILDAPENSVVLSPDNPIGQMRSTSVYCGIGRRYHSLVCTDAYGRNVSALTCNAFGMHLRSGLLNTILCYLCSCNFSVYLRFSSPDFEKDDQRFLYAIRCTESDYCVNCQSWKAICCLVLWVCGGVASYLSTSCLLLSGYFLVNTT